MAQRGRAISNARRPWRRSALKSAPSSVAILAMPAISARHTSRPGPVGVEVAVALQKHRDAAIDRGVGRGHVHHARGRGAGQGHARPAARRKCAASTTTAGTVHKRLALAAEPGGGRRMEPLAAVEQGDQETGIDQDRIARRQRPLAALRAAVAGRHRAARRLMPLAGLVTVACAARASRVAFFASKLQRSARAPAPCLPGRHPPRRSRSGPRPRKRGSWRWVRRLARALRRVALGAARPAAPGTRQALPAPPGSWSRRARRSAARAPFSSSGTRRTVSVTVNPLL